MNQLCECANDGYCERYRREMNGRFREICQGRNVDLGTAAAFREQWRREVQYTRQGTRIDPVHILLKTGQAPGDAVAMTAAIYSLHQSHPGRYQTSVESYWPEVFAHNPNVVDHRMPSGVSGLSGLQEVDMHYPAIHKSNERGIHFMQGWCEFLGSALNVPIPLLTNRPRLYFKDELPVEDFWLVCSGGKRDFTTKLWGHYRYQEVINRLYGQVRFVQVGGSKPSVAWRSDTLGSQEDEHRPLDYTTNMLGKTSLRDLFDLVRRSRGVLCGVSLLMHVAAACEKPAVIIAGAREPVQWNAYPKQQYLHNVGMLDCRDNHGRRGGACWRYRTVPLHDGTMLDTNTCERPIGGTPDCMTLISPERVADLIAQYNRIDI